MKRGLFCLTLALSISTKAEKIDSPIKIGVAMAQSSNIALLGQEQIIGARLAEKFYNSRGGINGTPIKLVFQDTGGDETTAVIELFKLWSTAIKLLQLLAQHYRNKHL